MSDVLARICETTRAEVARRKAGGALSLNPSPPRGFARALKKAGGTGGFGLIAEIKKASPSGGMIRRQFAPAELARAYVKGGAACLSVLTDVPHFQGSPAHLREAREAVALPVLRKDFLVDPWQIAESRAMGADCVLLIMAALSDAEAAEFEQAAHALGMDVLAEVHDGAELDRALRLKTGLIGINNRNLKTLQTDLKTSLTLAPMVPADRMVVAESGLRTHDDLKRLAEVGVRAFLVGESLLRQADVAAATRVLLGSLAR
jgi:indole-3-glycerol phosphate synthase